MEPRNIGKRKINIQIRPWWMRLPYALHILLFGEVWIHGEFTLTAREAESGDAER